MALVDTLQVFVQIFWLFYVKSWALWQFLVIFLFHVLKNGHEFEIEDYFY
jgi:hypothetical protein